MGTGIRFFSRLTTAGALAAAIALAGCSGSSSPGEPAAPRFDTGVSACGATSDPALDQRVVPGAIDEGLMDRAIRLAANDARCKAGLAPLDPDPRLAAAAGIHAGDMADAGFLAATRPADPTKTLKVRFEMAGVGPYRRRAENLMKIPLMPAGPASAGAKCGGPLAPTYRMIARRLVNAWSKSEAYSANLLSPEWTHTGAAAAVRPVRGTCGDVYAAQSFKAL